MSYDLCSRNLIEFAVNFFFRRFLVIVFSFFSRWFLLSLQILILFSFHVSSTVTFVHLSFDTNFFLLFAFNSKLLIVNYTFNNFKFEIFVVADLNFIFGYFHKSANTQEITSIFRLFFISWTKTWNQTEKNWINKKNNRFFAFSTRLKLLLDSNIYFLNVE